MSRYSTAGQLITASAVAAAFAAGVRLSIYTGAQPSSPNDAATGTLLATIALPEPAFLIAPGLITSHVPSDPVMITGSGTAGWWRLWRVGDTDPATDAISSDVRIDGSIALIGDDGDIELSSLLLLQGGTITLAAFQITFPFA